MVSQKPPTRQRGKKEQNDASGKRGILWRMLLHYSVLGAIIINYNTERMDQ